MSHGIALPKYDEMFALRFHLLIQFINFFRKKDFIKKLVDVTSLCCKQNTIIC